MTRCPTCGLRLPSEAPKCPVHGEVVAEQQVQLQAVAGSSPAHSAVTNEERRSEPPPPIPGFSLKRVLGRGGYGVVYAAEREQDGAKAAVKLSLPEQFGADVRLANEANLLVDIGPPFVPAVFAHGKIGDRYYVALQFIEARTLADVLVAYAGPVPLSRFGAYASTILDALDAVHKRGFVHADLKPENIFIETNIRARLIDFGSSRGGKLEAVSDRTEELAVGTAEYMAPEQCEGRPDIDQRADIYSVAVLFYEMLTGAPPFWGNATEVREAHTSRRPARFAPSLCIPTEIEDVILRCLAKEPARRYESVRALREALMRAVANVTGDADPSSQGQAGTPPVSMVMNRPPTGSGRRTPTGLGRPPPSTREQRTVGLLFFETSSGLGAVREALSSRGGQLAQAKGSQYVAAFGHDVGDNPARSALLAGQAFVDSKLCARAVVDVATVSVQRRPNGEQRFFSPLFSKQEQFPRSTDPAGVLMTQSSVNVLTNVPVIPVPDREGIYRPDFAAARDSTTIYEAREDTLVGRADMLETLTRSARQAVSTKQPYLLSVIGEPGYGKSHLAARLLSELAGSMPATRALWLAGVESMGGAAYPMLRELLRSVLALPDEAPDDHGKKILGERLGGIGQQLWAAGALVLGWVSTDHPEVRVLSAAPGALRSAASRLGGEALRRAAESTPVLLVVDDAHLLEEAALDAIEYAALREANAAFWCAAFARPAFTEARPNWGHRAAHSEQIQVPALDGASAAELVKRLLRPVENVPPAVLDRIVERTQRVPRLIVELVNGLKRAGLVRKLERGSGYYLATDELDKMPDLPVVEWAAKREIEALPAQLAGHARLASVLGDRFTIEEMEGVLRRLETEGSFEDTQLDASVGVRRLVDRGLLARSGGNRFDFRHNLLRETIYRSLPDAQRSRIHAAAYEMFRDMPQLRDEERLPRLAFHAAKSGLTDEAGRTYLSLAERAQKQHAYLDAELMYTNALGNLEATSSGALSANHGRGIMRFRLGRCEDALKDLEAAIATAHAGGQAEKELELLLDEATVLDWLGDFPRSAELTQKARTTDIQKASELMSARLEMALGRVHHRSGDKEIAIEQNLWAAARAESIGDAGYETFVTALVMVGSDCASLGRFDEAENVLARVIEQAEARGDLLHVAAALNNRTFISLGRGDAVRMIRDLERVLQIMRQTGVASFEFHAAGNLGEVHFNLADYAAAEKDARVAAEVAERLWGENWALSHAELLLARVALYAGDLPSAQSLIAKIQERLERTRNLGQKDAELIPTDKVLLDMMVLALGDSSDEQWQTLADRCREASILPELAEVLETWGRKARKEGRLDRARESLEKALELASVVSAITKDRINKQLQALDATPSA